MTDHRAYINRILCEVAPRHGAKFDRVWDVIDKFPTIREENPFAASDGEASSCARQLREALRKK